MFWIFMACMDALLPITMIVLGRQYKNNPPKEINWGSGYRSSMSMKNKDTWKFAHEKIGKIWYICGCVLLPVSIALLFFVIGKNTDTIGEWGGKICITQIFIMIVTVFRVEAALRKTFDKNGYRRKQANESADN